MSVMEHAMPESEAERLVETMIERARAAQASYEALASQDIYDLAALAVGWALMEPNRNAELSELAVATTGLGNVSDKITKNHRKTLGLLRDIAGQKTQGIVEEDLQTLGKAVRAHVHGDEDVDGPVAVEGLVGVEPGRQRATDEIRLVGLEAQQQVVDG